MDWFNLFKNYWYFPVGFIWLTLLVFVTFRWRIKYFLKRDKEKNELKHKLAQMEMQALRNQMNPHFIFNAINSIQHYVLTNEKELANKYLVKFSKLIRRVLEFSKEDLISLRDELENIGLYVEIESLRFEDAFDFKLNVSKELDPETIKLPHLIIQPFVENAIWHGLLLKAGEKKLEVSINKKDNNLIIEIDDNGIGRKAASEFENYEYKRKSLGMEITKDRLLLLKKTYGIIADAKIFDKLEKNGDALGTKVVICIGLDKM